jgi:hypothetical protein
MSIAGIFGSSVLSLLTPSTPTALQKTKQEFQQLGQDLKLGNLSAAQSDITACSQASHNSLHLFPRPHQLPRAKRAALSRKILRSFPPTCNPEI